MADFARVAVAGRASMGRMGVAAVLSAAALSFLTIPELAAAPIGVLQATPAALQGVVDTIPLASHRAVYDLSLLKAVGTKSPTGARGRIAFDFSGSSCDGYVQNFRQLTEFSRPKGRRAFPTCIPPPSRTATAEVSRSRWKPQSTTIRPIR